MTIPLRWAAGDRAVWRGREVLVEYVAEDGALVSYVATDAERLARGPSSESHRCAIVALSDLQLRCMS